jgi:hypothetical protein
MAVIARLLRKEAQERWKTMGSHVHLMVTQKDMGELKRLQDNPDRRPVLDLCAPSTLESPLHLACELNRHDVAAFLIETRSTLKLNQPERLGRWTPLHLAVHSGAVGIAGLLLARLSLEAARAVDEEGHDALHIAAGEGFAEIVSLLLEAGFDSDRACADEANLGTPAHECCRWGHVETLKASCAAAASPAPLTHDRSCTPPEQGSRRPTPTGRCSCGPPRPLDGPRASGTSSSNGLRSTSPTPTASTV